MMVGEGVEEELGPEEPRPMEEWPPPTTSMEVTNKDSSSSRLLFLTVQYVGDEGNTSFQTGLENFSELGQRVVSPLDPNMGCTACYSPVYGPVSPTGGYLTATTPPSTSSGLQEPGMIVLSEPCQLSASDSYVVSTPAQQSRVYGDEGKLLLFTESNPPTEMMVSENGEQRVELLLSNGTIAYGIVEATDSNGTRIIQIPREYLIAARPQNTEIPEEVVSRQETTVVEENVQDENGHLRALYNTLKEQGLIIETGDLQVETGEPLIDTSLLEHTTLLPSSTGPLLPPPQPQQRFWCEECNVLLDSSYCMEHQINRKISDKAVPSRARATLPASYLAINLITDSDIEEYGVFARKTIPKRTQFGPMEGVPIKVEEVTVIQEGPHIELTIENELGELRALDVSNEHMSNWMRFVRIATPERPPNLLVSQLGASLFFTSTHSIHAKEELLVWYSPAYAIRRNLPADPPPPVWSCSTCGEKLKNHTELMDHSTRHVKKSIRQENLTVNSLRQKNQAFVATVNKDITQRNAQGKSRFECAVCNKRFPRGYSLKRHILLLHTRENKYHCKICHLGFSHVYNRLRHMRKAHPTHKETAPKHIVRRYESWSCSHCKLTFSSASILNLHTLVHAANNVEENTMGVTDESCKPQEFVSCPQCSQKFSNNRKLASHVAEHGKNKDTLNLKFHCDICGRNFISAVRFQAHKELHGDDERKPLQCHICKKRLLTQSALTCHLKVHDCNVQWECPMCKQHFGNVFALRAHVHTHAVQGLYECPHCVKTFEEYSGIRKHVRAFHSARTHICKDCGKSFPSQDKLRMHQLRHSDRREFLCADCGKQFKRKDKLKEHMKRIHSTSDKGDFNVSEKFPSSEKKVFSKLVVNMSDYERYIYKCHSCVLGFKRRGMLVNHLANRHPDITPESVPELNLPILKTTRDYYCQYCDKIYKSSSKRKAHILKNHPGLELPMSNRQKGGVPDIPGLPNPTFSQTVGSVTTNPHGCQWCHKQYASKAKLLQHQRKKHVNLLSNTDQISIQEYKVKNPESEENIEKGAKNRLKMESMAYENIAGEDPIPVALAPNINHHMTLSTTNLNQLQEYEIATTGYDAIGHNVLMDTSSIIKKSGCKIPRPLKNLESEENIGKDGKNQLKMESMTYENIADGDPFPVALSANINHHMTLSTANLNQLQEYEIVTSEYDVTANGVLVDASSIIKKSGCKNDNISSDLLSQAISEIDVSLSDLRALTTDQYLKLLQSPGGPDSLYMPYPAR